MVKTPALRGFLYFDFILYFTLFYSTLLHPNPRGFMLAVAIPEGPTFLDHFNPDNRLMVITSCPDTGDTMEREYSFLMYFWMFGELSDDYDEIALHFDIDGYYETTAKYCPFNTDKEYIVTMYPLTDNTRR